MRTQYITSIGLIYNVWGFYLEVLGNIWRYFTNENV